MLPGTHSSLGRTSTADQNNVADWHDLYYPSPGQPNSVNAATVSITRDNIEISEIGLWGRQYPWVELRVKRGPVDISALSFSDFNGDDVRIGSAPKWLQTGDRVVLRWSADDAGHDIILNGRPPNRVADQAALVLGAKVIDAVAWREEGATLSPDEANDIKRYNLTPYLRPLFVRGTEHIPTLARPEKLDAWEWAFVPTPGAENKAFTPPPAGSVRIQAVSPSEFAGDWAELVCAAGPVDISAFVLTDLDGDDAFLSKVPVTLNNGDTVIVHWSDGANEVDGVGDINHNGARDIYLRNHNGLSSTDDQLVLVCGSAIYDAVVFTNGDGAMSKDEQKDLKYLIEHGAWTGSVCSRAPSTSGRIDSRSSDGGQ